MSELAEGQRLAHEGAAAAFDSIDERYTKWRTEAEQALDLLITERKAFTSDDIYELAGDPPKPNAMGGLFHTRQDDMQVIGYRPTERKAGHARIIRVWQAR